MMPLRDNSTALRVCFGLLFSALTLSCTRGPTTNVLLIVADDMGWGDLSLHGNPNVRTPHLDGLARSGIEFTDFYVSAVCSPTRAELLTGRHALALGVTGTGAGEERVDTGAVMLPQVLAKAGYRNALFGKWHNGAQAPNHPLSRGFEEFFGFTEGHWATYFDAPMLEGDGALTQGSGYLPDQLTDRTIEWLGRDRAAPTFTMLNLPTPHSPMQVPDRWFDAVFARGLDSLGNGQGEEDPVFTQAALAMVENIDWNVGRVLRALDSLGLRQNTLVIFMSDNGPNNWRWNAGMRGRKGSVDEGGVRSPLFVSLPGSIAAGQTEAAPLSVRDLFATLCDYLGVDRGGVEIDGRSFAERLTDPDVRLAPKLIVRQWQDRVSVREDSFVLDDEGRLYNVVLDRGQTVDLREERPGVAARLEAGKAAFWYEHPRPAERAARPYLVGADVRRATTLTSGESIPDGGVERNSRHPNSTYLSDWGDTASVARWSVDVATAGDYAVEVYCTVPPAAAGGTLSLRRAGAPSVAASSALLPYDPPVLGAADDRIVRDEGYYKAFRPVGLGRLYLGRGPGTLELRWVPDSTAAAGGPGPDVRLLRLTSVN